MKNTDPKKKVRSVNEETEDPVNSIEQDEPRSETGSSSSSSAPHFDQQVRTSDSTTEVEGSKASHADTFETDSRPGSGI